MLHVWQRRFPYLDIVLATTRVQGEDAPRQIAAALSRLGEFHQGQPPGRGLDLIILARGGGSPEELAVFNDERVARAIFAACVPVVSAVGHEVDYTIADLVADVRAPTPSAAAQMVVPDVSDLQRGIQRGRERLAAALRGQVAAARSRTVAAEQRLERVCPLGRVEAARRQVDDWSQRATRALAATLGSARARLAADESRLAALNPEMTLRRGYAICRRADDGAVVSDAGQLDVGDGLELRFARGQASSVVQEVILPSATPPEEAHVR
jgi:exodeoxyribonuclease VII large subunit